MCQVIDIMHSLYLKINRKSKLNPTHHLAAVSQTNTHKIFRLINAQLDQPTHSFLLSASHSPWFHISFISYTYCIKDIPQLDLQKMWIIFNMFIDIFFLTFVKLTIIVAWFTCASIKILNLCTTGPIHILIFLIILAVSVISHKP